MKFSTLFLFSRTVFCCFLSHAAFSRYPSRFHSRILFQLRVICYHFFHRMDHIFHVFVGQSVVQRNTHDFVVVFLRIRAQPFFITQFFIIRVPVYRQIMYLWAGILCIQRVKKLPSVAVQVLRFRCSTYRCQVVSDSGISFCRISSGMSAKASL